MSCKTFSPLRKNVVIQMELPLLISMMIFVFQFFSQLEIIVDWTFRILF